MKGLMGLALMRCERIADFVYDYADGNLPSQWQAMRFEAHIMLCKRCREYVLLYKAAADAGEFRRLNEPPEELLETTLDFLTREGVLGKEDVSAKPNGGAKGPGTGEEE